jgi:plastocyanin
MLTTSLVLSTFASLALSQVTVTVTQTVLVSNAYTTYTSTGQSTYTTTLTTSVATGATATGATTTEPSVTSEASGTGSAPSTPTSTANATATHSVQVGPGGALVYTPSNISANVGDTVQFFFNPKNHTVSQSSFTEPCKTIQGGLDSEFTQPTNVSLTTVGFQFVVNDTKPLWFYCEQTTHCKKGMVFAVNANENKTFAAFLQNALNSNSSSSPSSPSGSGTGSSGASATDTGASSSSTSSDAIAIPVNVGLTAVVAVIGSYILAL